MAVVVIDKIEIKNNPTLPVTTAGRIEVTASGFSGNLSAADTTAQAAFATLDALDISSSSDLATHAALTSGVHGISAFGATLVGDANAAAVRTTLGLGSAAQASVFDFEAAGAVSNHAVATSGVHGISTYGATLVDDANAATARSTLGLGTAAVASTGDFEPAGAVATHEALTSGIHGISTFAATILDDTTASAVRSTLGLGTLATQSGTFSGTSSGTNTGDQTISLTGDVTGSGTGSFAATIASAAVTLAKMANVASGTVFYRKTASSGVPEVQTLSTLKTDLGLTGTNSGDQTISLTGDVTGSGTGSFAATIASAAVTYAKIQNVSATDKILGRSSSGAGSVEEIACTAAGRALIDDATASDQRTTLGLGTLATQSGTFSGTSSGTNTGDQTIALTGDVTGSGTGSFTATIANSAVTLAKMADVATATVFYRKTAGTGAPEVQTLATLKTDLGLTGTNSGDQTISLTGDVTGSGTGSFAATIAAAAVTLAKMANVATSTVFYRKTASTGVPEVQTLATLKTDLGLTGTNSGDQTISLTGDVTGSGTGSFAATIANDAVTYAKMQNVSATDKVLGRSTAGSGDVEEIACTAAGRALLDDANAAAQRTTLGLGTAALSATGDFEAAGSIATHAALTSSVHGISAFGATLVDDADASAARSTLGLGSFATISSLAHSATSGLTSGDDHTQYALLAGRSGGQTLIGGTASGNSLTLQSTSNATRGKILLGSAGTTAYDEVNARFGVGTASPTALFSVANTFLVNSTGNVGVNQSPSTTAQFSVTKNYTDPASIVYCGRLLSIANTITSNNANTVVGFQGAVWLNQAGFNATAAVGSVHAISSSAYATGASGTVTHVYGVYALGGNTGAGTLTNYTSFLAGSAANSGGGTLTTNNGFYVQAQTVGTNIYGFRGSIQSSSGRYNLYMDGTAQNYLSGNLGIGNASPTVALEVSANSNPTIVVSELASTTSYLEITDVASNNAMIRKVSASGVSPLLDLDANPADGTSVASVRFFRNTTTTGVASVQVFAAGATQNSQIGGIGDSYLNSNNGLVGIGRSSPGAQLHIASVSNALSLASWGATGIGLRVDAATYTNTTTGAGTLTAQAAHGIATPSFNSTNVITITNAATLYIGGSPAATGNTTITNGWGIWLDSGNARFDGAVGIGNISATPVSDLEVSSQTQIDGSDPTTITIRSTTNSSSWTTDAHWGRLDFWSNDLSALGSAPRARIAAAASSSSGAGTNLIFYTDSGGVLTEAFRFSNNSYAQFGGSTASSMVAITSVSTAPGLLRIDAPASHANHAIDVVNNGTRFFTATSGLTVNVGTQTTASAKLHVMATADQLRVGYDASNYLALTVSSAGVVTFDAVGASAGFTFSDSLTMADAKDIILNTTTGTKIGTATTQKLAFYNSTPIIQRVGAAQAAVATTGATNSVPYGFTTAAQANAIVTLVNELRAAMVALGLIKGAA